MKSCHSTGLLPLVASLLLILLSNECVVQAQLEVNPCTSDGNHDSASCVEDTDVDGTHCCWCSVSRFGLCVNERAAELFEKSINAHCDRYNGDDDNNSNTDDQTPTEDDAIAPTDDAIPDDFWTCLQDKTETDCAKDECTWCDTKAGFGLCLTGPAAESASHSDWFDCKNSSQVLEHQKGSVSDPYDPSCIMAFLGDQTKEGCTSASDKNGDTCLFCSLAGIANLCLNQDQASMGSAYGVACDGQKQPTQPQLKGSLYVAEKYVERLGVASSDIYDPSCALAYLKDQSEDGCTSAVDQEGNACEYCSYQDSFNVCLTQEQAEFGGQIGLTCDGEVDVGTGINDIYDVSCLMAFLKDQSEEGCTAAVDQDGNACEFCSYQDSINLCLAQEQAEFGAQVGLTCDSETIVGAAVDDIYDPSCVLAYLKEQSEDGCTSAVDQDGNACEYCSYQDSFYVCLTQEQAEFGGQIGLTCDDDDVEAHIGTGVNDIYDVSCLMAFLKDQSEEGCTSAVDQDGNACEFCSYQDSINVCLTQEQAEFGAQVGLTCNDNAVAVKLPPDFFSCMQNDKDECASASCTWCTTTVFGLGVCLADPAARALKECSFFTCDEDTSSGVLRKGISAVL